MSRNSAMKLSKLVRPARFSTSTALRIPPFIHAAQASIGTQSSSKSIWVSSNRSFSTSRPAFKGLSPESEDPAPKEAEEEAYMETALPTDVSPEEYHEFSDAYLNNLIEQLEELQEQREEVDVEYSAGVLTLAFPPNGTYVINKQPPNKQIWLSSPISGPKRFDYVMRSEGQDAKEGTGRGEWVYLRDGSTLTDLLEKELGIHVGAHHVT